MTESGIPESVQRQAACLANWERLAGSTAPADRRAAEAAAVACHKAFVWLGKLEKCIWVGSFREMRCVLESCAPPLSWQVMYRMRSSRARAATSRGEPGVAQDAACAFNTAMSGLGWFETYRRWEPAEDSEENSRWFDDDEEEEEDSSFSDEDEPEDSFDPVVDVDIDWDDFLKELREDLKIDVGKFEDPDFDPRAYYNLIRHRMDKQDVIPVVYKPAHWAALDEDLAAGKSSTGWLSSLSMEVLRHCAAFFPLPGAMLLCERPLRVEGTQTGAGRLVEVEFRSGVVEYNLDGMPLTRRQYDFFLDWDLVNNSRILLELEGGYRRRACFARGIESMASEVYLYYVKKLDDHWLRRQFVEALPPERLLDFGDITWTKEKEGELARISMPGDEDLCVLRVKDATPAPDGTEKYHFLRVPPTVESVREAIAWTFGIDDPEDYAPVVET